MLEVDDVFIILLIIIENMDKESHLSSSLSDIRFMEDVKKEDRFYLRYYLTIKRARQLNEDLYKGQTDKTGN